MQTIRNAVIMPGGSQEPLLTADQLCIGAFVTGVAATHLWEIVDISRTDITLQKLPRPAMPCATHNLNGFHYTTPGEHGQAAECTCGLRKTGISELLPKVRGKARIHIITCDRQALQKPAIGEVYAYLSNDTPMFAGINPDGVHWSDSMPLVPILHKVWELPSELQALAFDHNPTNEESEGELAIPF